MSDEDKGALVDAGVDLDGGLGIETEPDDEVLTTDVETPGVDVAGEIPVDSKDFGLDRAEGEVQPTPRAARPGEVGRQPAVEPPAAIDDRLIDTALRHNITAEDLEKWGPNAAAMLEKLAQNDVMMAQQTGIPPGYGSRDGGVQQGAPQRAEGQYRPFAFNVPQEMLEDMPPGLIDGIALPVANEINQHRQLLGEIWGRVLQMQRTLDEAELDTFVGSVGEDFGHVYGKGRMGELQPGSSAWQARQALKQEADVLMDVRRRMGQSVSRSAALAQVHALKNQGSTAKVERDKIAKQLQKVGSQFIGRPQGRGASGPVPERSRRAAIEAVRKVREGEE